MAEWSKAQILDTRLFEGAGSNPVSGQMFFIFIIYIEINDLNL